MTPQSGTLSLISRFTLISSEDGIMTFEAVPNDGTKLVFDADNDASALTVGQTYQVRFFDEPVE